MQKIRTFLKKFRRDEDGATMVEYAIMVALIAVVSILVVGAVGQNVFRVFDTTNTHLDSVEAQPATVGSSGGTTTTP